MKDCIFCKIISGEVPAFKIYEDDFTLAFLDIANDAYGHTLIIPKKHYDTMMTCDNTTLSHVMETVKKVGNHYVKDCGFDGWNIVNNTGEAAGPHMMHFHIHLIPRKFGDNAFIFPVLAGGGQDLQTVCNKLKFEDKKSKINDENAVVIYTDGACSGNPGAGGWASIISYKGNEKVISGGERETTNNRMELMAVIMGLENANKNVPIEVFSDSAYVVNAFQQGWLDNWKRNNWKTSGNTDVQNKDLWKRLLTITENTSVHFNKVKGHSDNEQNNRCDALAREEIAKLN